MPQESNSRAIIVLGMHRSGTSAFSGLLNLLGVDLGPKLMPASSDNQSGYWEHPEVVAVHDRLLTALGSRWDDVSRLPDGWWRRDDIAPFRAQLRDILVRDFAGSPLWTIKDPRMCRLLPLWKSLLDELACAPVWVLIARHPFENIGSLDKRDGFSWQKSELLWLQHTLEAEFHTRDGPRVVVTFDQFLEDWQDTLRRLQRAIGLPWPVPAETAAERIAKYVDPGKRHHRAVDMDKLSPWSREVHAALLAGANGVEPEMRERLDAVRSAFETADALYDPVLRGRAGELKQQLAVENARYAELFETFQEMRVKYRAAKEKLVAKSGDLDAKKDLLRTYERSPGAKLNRLLRFRKPRPPRIEPVHFPPVEGIPETTVILSTGRDPSRAARCLRALREQTAGKAVEVLAVADEALAPVFKDWKNLDTIRGSKAESFAEPQKRAAQRARGAFLIFLQDRIIPGAGWYEALIEPLRALPEGGVVGLDAGLIKRDGSIEMLPEGGGEALRKADFCTTASLAVPKHLFFQVGGFDGYYLPVEEAAFGLKIAQTKCTVWQQPRCRILREAPPDRVDPERFQSNWRRFARRWPDALAHLS